MKRNDFIELFPENIDPTRLDEFNGVSLDTLAHWHILAACCKACGRVSALNRHKMIKELGNQYLRHLEPKLCCNACKRHGGKFLLGQQPR
jgi:hypothetical protein